MVKDELFPTNGWKFIKMFIYAQKDAWVKVLKDAGKDSEKEIRHGGRFLITGATDGIGL